VDADLLGAMSQSIAHRGPDDRGAFQEGEVGLAHRRLSIIDPHGGHQPLKSEDGSVVLVANGEVYNHEALRGQLLDRGHEFATRSDSEVILHLYEEVGAKCVEQLNGMFAFAIWDRRARRLLLARDRLGIKPLYYAQLGEKLLFASELKAILRHAALQASLDPFALRQYLALRYVPGPGTLFREIRKLPAGHTARFEAGELHLDRYWRPPLEAGPFQGDERAYLEGFRECFERSVQRRLIADVPLGAYLSGGVDSSTIVAVMSKFMAAPVRTFTVGFGYEHDELSQAAETAKLLGCCHTEIACRPRDIALLPEVVWHLDEPIGDAIVVPMYQLAREASREVKVVLSGEGADELLGGYLFHRALLWGRRLARLPRSLRRGVLSRLVGLVPASVLNLAFSYPAALGERGKQKVLDFLMLLDEEQLPHAYRHLISLFDERDCEGLFSAPFEREVGKASPSNAMLACPTTDAPYLNRVIDLQFDDWLPDDILMKQDKVSMAHGVEARVPFLDHELVEFALCLPPAMKTRGFASKSILRRYAAGMLPRATRRRRKMPFYLPVEQVLEQAAFQEVMADVLSEQVVRERGFFRPKAVEDLKRELRGGEFVRGKQVLSLVILELWMRAFVDRRGVR